VVAIKVAGGDDAWYRAMEPVFGRLGVFVPGHLLASGLARGARGSFSNVACLSPRGAQQWYELCLREPAEGQKWEQRISRFWLECVAPLVTENGLSNVAADKAAAVAGGWLPGLSPRLRWPYRGASDELVRSLAASARARLPEWFDGS
jgi:dihydrodipicolinate synthase/N-acetylneuraminate lyase